MNLEGRPSASSGNALVSNRNWPEDQSEDQLIERIGRGDRAAFTLLVTRKWKPTILLAHRLLGDGWEAEDIAQEALLRTWLNAPNWCTGVASFSTWLYRVVVNLCVDQRRRRRDITWVSLEMVADLIDITSDPMAQAQNRELIRIFFTALATLPARQNLAIVKSYIDECSTEEVALAMGISTAALESLLARGRRNLRQFFANS
jgi:RNA polymerase sigma-70 factor, ECF subfamily